MPGAALGTPGEVRVELICILLTALLVLLLIYVVFSWIPRPPEPILPLVRAVDRVFTPVLEPIRRVLPPVRMGGIALDLSVLVLFLVIFILESALGCA